MSVEISEEVITAFLKSAAPEVLALTGSWGVGKTFVWNKLLRQCRTATGLKRYAYVSLFGVSSVAQLRTSIMLKTRPLDQLNEPLNLNTLNAGWFSRALTGARELASNIGSLREWSWGKGLTLALETVAPFAISDTIICLDDFERINSVSGEEILGLVSELKEERNCKIVMIFNFDKLTSERKEAAAAYAAYREKVVDIEVKYEPTIDEAFKVAFEDEFPYRDEIAKRVRSLEITNIRVLRKLRATLIKMMDAMRGLHENVALQAIPSLILFFWCVYQPGPDKMGLGELPRWKKILWSTGIEEQTTLEKTWGAKLRDYGFVDIDELDFALAKFVEQGYVGGSGLIEEAKKADEAARAGVLNERFSAAWQRLRNSFADDAAEVVAELFETARKSVQNVSLGNLDSTVGVLRALGANEQADDLIKSYVQANNDKSDRLDLGQAKIFGPLQDKPLADAVADAHARIVKPTTLQEAVDFISKNEGWKPEHIDALMRATEDEIFEYLRQSSGSLHQQVIKVFLHSGSGPEHDAIHAKGMAALQRIAATSPINRLRVERFTAG